MDPIGRLLNAAVRDVLELAGSRRLELRDKGAEPGRGIDLVTEGDLRVDRRVTEGLRTLHPGISILSEEGQLPRESQQGDAFVLDPIDGTHNFAAGLPHWAVSLARTRGDVVEEAWLLEAPSCRLFHARRGGEATCDGDTLRVAARDPRFLLASVGLSHRIAPLLIQSERFSGVRMMGSHALGLAWSAEGRLGLHAGRGYPWDVAAGYLLVEAAGGRVVDFEGRPRNLWKRDYALAGAPAAVEVALEILRSTEGSTWGQELLSSADPPIS